MCIRDRDNVVADILSRYPADVEQQETNEETHEYLINHLVIKMSQQIGKIIRDIGKYQNEDAKLGTLIDKIKNNDVDNKLSKFYKIVNNKLYRRQRGEWKIYIPDSVSKDLIAEIHQMYGHLGPKRCIKMLQEHFTIDSLFKKVKAYIQTCDSCQRYKDTNLSLIHI